MGSNLLFHSMREDHRNRRVLRQGQACHIEHCSFFCTYLILRPYTTDQRTEDGFISCDVQPPPKTPIATFSSKATYTMTNGWILYVCITVFSSDTFLTTTAIIVFFPSPPSLSAAVFWLYLLWSPSPQPPLLLYYYYYYYYYCIAFSSFFLYFVYCYVCMYVGLCM